MDQQLTLSLVRAWKGCPLSVYVVLLLSGQALAQSFIERHTGYTDKPVSQALALLEESGMVRRSAGGWRLVTDGSTQGVLPAAPAEIVSGQEESEADSLSGHEESLAELARLGVAINNRTRPLLDLTSKEIGVGAQRCVDAGQTGTGYLVTVLLGILETKRNGCVYDRNSRAARMRYAEWATPD